MKKLIGLVVILAALVLGGYYGMGLITERTLKKNVDVINQSNGLFVDIEQYDRGWFTSTALLEWRLHIPERVIKNENGQSTTVPAQDHKIKMPLKIFHGPFIWTDSTGLLFGLGYAHSDLGMPPSYVAKFNNLFTSESNQPKLRLSIFVNYLNNSRLHIGLPEFKLFAKQGGDQFEWHGMDSDFSISSNLKNVDGSVTIDGVTLLKNKIKAILGNVTSEYELHQTDSGLYLGEASLSVPSLVVQENEQKIFEIDNFAARSHSGVENGLFSTYFKTSLDKMLARDKTYGPALLEMSIKNLDAQVLASINEQANKMQQGTDSERQQALFALLPQLPKLFGQGAQFEVSKLSLVMPEGAVEGDLLVSLPKGDTANPFQLLQKIQGQGKVQIPVPVLKEVMLLSVKQRLISQPALQQAMVQQLSHNNTTPTSAPAAQQTPSDAAVQTKNEVQSTVQKSVTVTDNQNVTTEKKETITQTQAVVPGQIPASTSPVTGPDQHQPITVADIEKQAQEQTAQKLSALQESGLLSLQGNNYVVEISLQQGQLTVNGKPFNSAMLQF